MAMRSLRSRSKNLRTSTFGRMDHGLSSQQRLPEWPGVHGYPKRTTTPAHESPSITAMLNCLDRLFTTATLAPLTITFSTPFKLENVDYPGIPLDKQTTARTPTYSISVGALSHLTIPNCDLSPTSSASNETWLSTATASQPPLDSRAARASGSGVGQKKTTSASHGRDSGIGLYPEPGQQPYQDSQPRFMMVVLDVDYPFYTMMMMSPFLHGVQIDLRAHTDYIYTAISNGKPYVPLTPDMKAEDWGEVVKYIGPWPSLYDPGNAHRYLFLLYEQPKELTREKICQEIRFLAMLGPEDDINEMRRGGWNQAEFERRLGLQRVVAGNYIFVYH